nr:4'-phosphopantetheinyl transferase superfamily protein [Formosa sp. Hel1_31_208]
MSNTCDWRRPRFFDKVFTQKEQALILTSENQHQMVWLLWSMKEAAYKVHVQQFGEVFFNPKRLVCNLISEEKGDVRIDSNHYDARSTITEDYVYTIAQPESCKTLYSSIFKSEISSYTSQSSQLKQKLLRTISQSEQLDYQALNIRKTKFGVPQVFNNFQKLPLQFSLTHCGRYSGYVMC